MGRVETNHYPASEVPKVLRGNIDASALVKVVVEEEAPIRRLTLEQLTSMIEKARHGRTPVTTEEAVARVRELRDEWDV